MNKLDEIEKEYKNKIAELEWENEQAYSKGFDECLKQRLDKVIPMQKGYMLSCNWAYKYDKCDKCDDERKIWYETPRGNKRSEDCECSETILQYEVDDAVVDTWVFGYNDDKNIPSRYYRIASSGEEATVFKSDKKWVYKEFYISDDIIKYGCDTLKGYTSYVFESKEDAQKLCDYLNNEIMNSAGISKGFIDFEINLSSPKNNK